MGTKSFFNVINGVLKKRKAKVFFVFLLCSMTIWFLNSLSKTYVGKATFDLEFENIPEGYMFKGASKDKMDVKIRAGGFQFLGFNFSNKKVAIDLAEADRNNSKFYVPENRYRTQIENQISGSMALLEIDNDTLFLDMMEVITKKVPVRPRAKINLAQNFMLDGKITVTPDSVTITGPIKEIDSIVQVHTEMISLPDLDSNFSEETPISQAPSLKNTTYSDISVELSGKIARFSEKVLEVPIQITGLPENLQIKIFPEKVSVVCKAKVARLKLLRPEDFKVVARYKAPKQGAPATLRLSLDKKPEGLHNVGLKTNEVDYVVKRK